MLFSVFLARPSTHAYNSSLDKAPLCWLSSFFVSPAFSGHLTNYLQPSSLLGLCSSKPHPFPTVLSQDPGRNPTMENSEFDVPDLRADGWWSPAPWEQVVVEGAFLCVQPSVSALAKKAYLVLETQLHSIPCPPGPSQALFPWSLGRHCFPPGPPSRELREQGPSKGHPKFRQGAPMIVLSPQGTAAPAFPSLDILPTRRKQLLFSPSLFDEAGGNRSWIGCCPWSVLLRTALCPLSLLADAVA